MKQHILFFDRVEKRHSHRIRRGVGERPGPPHPGRIMIIWIWIEEFKSDIQVPKAETGLFVFFVHRVAAAATAELFELKPVRRALFVLGRHVVALFALRALQNNVISRHKTSRSLFVVRCSWLLFATIHEQRSTN